MTSGPLRARVEQAAAAVRAGGVVCFPTESSYGLAALALDDAAVARVISAKRRPPEAPIACVAASFADACKLWREPAPTAARALAERHWPGPLTLVCAAAATVPAALRGPAGVGVRVPAHELARALAEAVGAPLTATSANLSGQPPANSVDEARAQLGDAAVDVYLDGGRTAGGAPSTVVEVHDDGVLRVVRAGALTLSEEELSWPK